MIVFTENVKPLYFAYNNSVVRFNTDSLLPVANCEITGLSVPIKL